MKNICIVVDKTKSAIDILSRPIMENNPQLNITVCPAHPKTPSDQQLTAFEHFGKKADVIHFQYWKSAEMLKTRYDWIKNKKTILTHHNPYDLEEKDWQKEYDEVVVKNSYQNSKLPYAYKIPHSIDLEFFKFKRDYTKNKIVNMVAGRIEPNKGIKEVAQACKDLGYKFILVGRISDGRYFGEINRIGINFKEDVTEKELRDVYYNSAVHICNSKDGFESGTLPILEAMATGCPVITRQIGQVPDLMNGENMLVRDGDYDDLDDLKESIKHLMENREKREDMRRKAYKTVANRDIRFTSRTYSRLYQMTYYDSPIVSIIISTFNRPKNLVEILKALTKQSYKNFEVVVADDGSNQFNCGSMVRELNETIDYPIKYVNTGDTNEYHLAKARNMAVIETMGDILVFIDDRLKPQPKALANFVSCSTNKTWLYGDKGAGKRNFVENFSSILRQDFINAGMFNERINVYGGMSQEIRSRFRTQGFDFKYIEKAKSEEISSSKSRYGKQNDIKEAKYILNKLSL